MILSKDTKLVHVTKKKFSGCDSIINMVVDFHFSPQTTPDMEYISSLQLVNKFPEEFFKEVINLGFEHLAGKLVRELSDSVSHLCSEHGIKYSRSLLVTVESFLIFLNGCTKFKLNGEQLKNDLEELDFEQKRVEIILDLWNSKCNDLFDFSISQSLKVNELVDMEWMFGVVASCKEIKKLGSSFLRLKLVLDRGGKIQTVFLEMNLPQFYEFIREMEKAQASLLRKSTQ